MTSPGPGGPRGPGPHSVAKSQTQRPRKHEEPHGGAGVLSLWCCKTCHSLMKGSRCNQAARATRRDARLLSSRSCLAGVQLDFWTLRSASDLRPLSPRRRNMLGLSSLLGINEMGDCDEGVICLLECIFRSKRRD